MWKLRQFFEGDTRISVENVTTGCYASSVGAIVPNSVAVEIDGVEHLIAVGELDIAQVLTLQLPIAITVGATTVIRAYSKCDAETSDPVTSKPVDFSITNTVIRSCSPQTVITSAIKDRVRLFFSLASGTYANVSVGGTPMVISDFDYQVGETGNITGVGGVFGRPATGATFNTLIGNVLHTSPKTLSVTPKTLNYFTARYGYMEVIFNNGSLEYINYMQSGDTGVLVTYAIDDVIEIASTSTGYVVRKNGVVLKTVNKTITYAVTGGSIVPITSTIGTPVVWTLPTGIGSYIFTATVGNSLKFQKTVQVHSCAQAVDDNYTGTYNVAYNFNVGTNDTICQGENTYYEKVGIPGQVEENQGSVVFNQNGTGVYTPPLNYTSTATFYYNIRCGADFATSEIMNTAKVVIDYFDICAGVTANWQSTGNVRCNNCVEEKEERDINSQCTGNAPRWVANVGGSACSVQPNLVPTGLTRCTNCVNEQQVQDLNTCSPTYQQLSWVTNPNGSDCNSVPNWQDTGVLECQSCVEKKQQRDNNSCSTTYNTIRFIDNPSGTQCNRTPVWTDLDEFICINCVEYKKQQDTNPCSASFQLIKNTENPEGDVCTSDINWSDTGVTRCENGEHQKQQVATNQCNTETSRWIPTGLDVCSCEITVSLKNNCSDDNPIVGAVVTRTDIVENNRIISLLNNVITFKLDVGTFNYKVVVTLQNGMKSTISYPLKSCQPII